uniref:Uncharacterized protein n=1 Tax=Knipowitschia caucasica TaxID=637954 RepID=A0AAV2MIE6_KNICA
MARGETACPLNGVAFVARCPPNVVFTCISLHENLNLMNLHTCQCWGKVMSRSAQNEDLVQNRSKKAAALRLSSRRRLKGQTPLQPKHLMSQGQGGGARRPEPPAQARTARPYQEA